MGENHETDQNRKKVLPQHLLVSFEEAKVDGSGHEGGAEAEDGVDERELHIEFKW